MYPEHEKLDSAKLYLLDELVEWLDDRGFSICKLQNIGHHTGEIEHAKWRDLRVEFFGTTDAKLEQERQQMIKSLL